MKREMKTWALAAAVVPGMWGFMTLDSQTTRPAQPASQAGAADVRTERLVVPWSDPARPGTVQVELMSGDISVRGYDGKEVVIETTPRPDSERGDEHANLKMKVKTDVMRRNGVGSENSDTAGLHRIPNVATGLTVEEENNVMRVNAPELGSADLVVSIQVPRRTSLKLGAVTGGTIRVENVEGEIDASNVNGPVTLTNVAGTVIAHALNDDLAVVMTRVSGKPMSFSSMNGNIDVTLPPDIKANVRLETVQGEILTDFDLAVQPTQPKTLEDREGSGRYRVKLERAMIGTINGGGPEISFKNFNGDIRIRKGK